MLRSIRSLAIALQLVVSWLSKGALFISTIQYEVISYIHFSLFPVSEGAQQILWSNLLFLVLDSACKALLGNRVAVQMTIISCALQRRKGCGEVDQHSIEALRAKLEVGLPTSSSSIVCSICECLLLRPQSVSVVALFVP